MACQSIWRSEEKVSSRRSWADVAPCCSYSSQCATSHFIYTTTSSTPVSPPVLMLDIHPTRMTARFLVSIRHNRPLPLRCSEVVIKVLCRAISEFSFRCTTQTSWVILCSMCLQFTAQTFTQTRSHKKVQITMNSSTKSSSLNLVSGFVPTPPPYSCRIILSRFLSREASAFRLWWMTAKLPRPLTKRTDLHLTLIVNNYRRANKRAKVPKWRQNSQCKQSLCLQTSIHNNSGRRANLNVPCGSELVKT